VPIPIFNSLLQQAASSGSRSTVLRPLAWLLGLLIAGTVSGIEVKAPDWLLISLLIMTVSTVTLYLGSYIYCLFSDRDALRSETYSIQKLAIQKGIVGDSTVGILEGGRAFELSNSAPGDESE
jgi:hypothetical protein